MSSILGAHKENSIPLRAGLIDAATLCRYLGLYQGTIVAVKVLAHVQELDLYMWDPVFYMLGQEVTICSKPGIMA